MDRIKKRKMIYFTYLSDYYPVNPAYPVNFIVSLIRVLASKIIKLNRT